MRLKMGIFSIGMVIGLLLAGCGIDGDPSSESVTPEPGFEGLGTVFKADPGASDQDTTLVYVPVYSRLFRAKGSYWELAASLSIRNIDPDVPITIHQIDFYDTEGDLLEAYLDSPHTLKPMATVTLTLPQLDGRGGTGANFLVRWGAEEGTNEPIIEAVMAGVRAQQSFSFVRPGRVIEE